jgi:hypothetical protein
LSSGRRGWSSGILKVMRCFGKHCSCHLQCEYIMTGRVGSRECVVSFAWGTLLVKRKSGLISNGTWARDWGKHAMKIIFKEHMARRRGDEVSFEDHLDQGRTWWKIVPIMWIGDKVTTGFSYFWPRGWEKW